MQTKLLETDFDFDYFITHNSFGLTHAQIEQFKRQADEIITGGTTLYACYFDGFWIELLINDNQNTLIEQTKIMGISHLKHPQLLKLLDFTKLELPNIESVYGDKDERVVILTNGVMLYFNIDENVILLSKLFNKHEPSKKLVQKTLFKIAPNKITQRAIDEMENGKVNL